MLRIFFSSEDIIRTRVAPAADPVWETILSLHLLQRRRPEPVMAGWRRDVAHTLRRDGTAAQHRLLFALNPPQGYFPDFLTPYVSRDGFEAGLEAIRSTPIRQLHRDMTVLAGENALPSSAPELARGEPGALRRLTGSMRAYRETAISPYWPRIQAAVEADRIRRSRALLDGGTEGLLASLRPSMRWESGVLDVYDYPYQRELRIEGRGLLLVPSFFCSRVPVALLDPDLPPVLVYPVDRLGGILPAAGEPDLVPAKRNPEERAALADLLGRTRAAVLETIDGGCSTGEVARRLQISAAAASQHTTVLRNAGLIISQRERNTVLHTLTPLGRAILDH
ncbi:ArsR/SmtB family transcription factor [Micromonospora zhanjiangensis]